MTARRPYRISGGIPTRSPRDEKDFRRLLHTFNDEGWEGEAAATVRGGGNHQMGQVARDLPDDAVTPLLHPALINYESASVANTRQDPTDPPHLPGRLPTPPCARRRFSDQTLSQWDSSDTPKSFPFPECQFKGPDLVGCFDTGSLSSGQIHDSSTDVRGKLSRRASDGLLGNDHNQVLFRRKGSYRARRASPRKEIPNEDDPQPQNILHGAALLRGMRRRRARRFSQDGHGEDGTFSWESQDLPTVMPSLGSNSRMNVFDKPAATDAVEKSIHNWPRETSGEIALRTEGNTGNVACAQHGFHSVLLSTGDQWRPMQMPRPQRSRTSVSCRHSQPSSPSRTVQPSRQRILQDGLFRTPPQPSGHEDKASDDGSANAQERAIPTRRLTDTQLNMLASMTQDSSKSAERHTNHDPGPTFSEYITEPSLFGDQRQSYLAPAAPGMANSDFSTSGQNLFQHQYITPTQPIEESVRTAQPVLAQDTSSQKCDIGGGARVDTHNDDPLYHVDGMLQNDNESLSGDRTVLPNSDEPETSPVSLQGPVGLQTSGTLCRWPDLPTEIYLEIANYLSREEALNLRLVSRDFSIAMIGAVFGSVTVPFGKRMYDMYPKDWHHHIQSSSMFERYGLAIRKFGISFETDADLLAKAQKETKSNEQSSWWGSYEWPTPVYSRFNHLHILENLADNVALLKSAMTHLGKTHELGLSIDSGHGWLNASDISDMALFDARCGNGTKVFGKNLVAQDREKQATRAHLFECAQARTLEECTQILRTYNKLFGSNELAYLKSVAIRDLESFRSIVRQPDFDALAHVGGAIPDSSDAEDAIQQSHGGQELPNGVTNGGLYHLQPLQQLVVGQTHDSLQNSHQQQLHNDVVGSASFDDDSVFAPPVQSESTAPNMSPGSNGHGQIARDRNRTKGTKQEQKTQPQYPLIFNGYNIAAEIGGWCQPIQSKIASPQSFPLQPGTLTEAQAQWLMETVWAQRAFLSAYVTAVLGNKAGFSQVHSLHIGKISSGLLSSLEQRELWQGLPGLVNLTVLVIPDWRIEHITGDQSFNTNMLASPADASVKMTEFLRIHIAPLEKLSNLTIGFMGGGEHARGIMARNQHVLPAPITTVPRTWLTKHATEPDPHTIITFSHIKHLTVQNAWFSPLMLETFMNKSCDTSLRTLVLNSVSLTATHGRRVVGPLTTATKHLEPIHPPAMWLHESLPTRHCWPATIDRITPGPTFVDRKYDAGMIADTFTYPRPSPAFRGFVSRLEFRSCGYVHVSGMRPQEFNQNDLVYPNSDPMDAGLKARAAALSQKGVMLSDRDPTSGAEWPLLGKLTQCIHPIEKRVLEEAWGMKFGWDDDLERWGAVEDGCFEGGTGRFTGVIVGQGGRGIEGDEE